MKHLVPALILLLNTPLLVFSQQGPGGVGATDGTSTLKYWVDANRGFTSTPTISWADQSGKGVTNTAGGIPILTPAFLNGQNFVTFNRNDGADIFTTNMSLNAGTFPQVDVFTVYYTDGSASTGGIWGEDDGGWDRFILNDPGVGCANGISIGGGCTPVPGAFPANLPVISSVFINQPGTNLSSVQINGATALIYTALHAGGSRNFGLGSIDAVGGFGLNGKIAEVIVFGSNRNAAERIIVNNYLSAKYNIVLSANDIYKQDDAVNDNFDFNVAGIGRIDASNFSNSARGTGILAISNPAGLDDNEFLLWGNDNGSSLATNTTDIPIGVQARFNKVWRVSEKNMANVTVDVGAIDMRWDLGNFSPVVASDLRLLVDTDNDNSFADETPIAGATLISAGIYQFAAVTAIEDSRRFTIGTANSLQTALPVNLAAFRATTVNNESVLLTWQTATEINNDRFDVERSRDNNWELVAKVKGVTNSNQVINYTTTDPNPYPGISYYRLKQVDIDGSFKYSAIEKINIDETPPAFQVYPNPADQHLFIRGKITSAKELQVYDQSGKNLSHLIGKSVYSRSQGLRIDVSRLPTGLYFIKSGQGSSRFVKK
ncbi:T9SS type A sorting domain-containing protein [Flavitalea sp.]|nr:T9SS type A sorting domain-containing protein [Flavitalea sp.]